MPPKLTFHIAYLGQVLKLFGSLLSSPHSSIVKVCDAGILFHVKVLQLEGLRLLHYSQILILARGNSFLKSPLLF